MLLPRGINRRHDPANGLSEASQEFDTGCAIERDADRMKMALAPISYGNTFELSIDSPSFSDARRSLGNRERLCRESISARVRWWMLAKTGAPDVCGAKSGLQINSQGRAAETKKAGGEGVRYTDSYSVQRNLNVHRYPFIIHNLRLDTF